MKQIEIYLLPFETNGRTLVLEYRIHRRKEDLRTRFCKTNKEFKVNEEALLKAIKEVKPLLKENRIIMKDAEMSREFSKYFK